MRNVLAAIVGVVIAVVPVRAQNCEYCLNHPFYAEHQHGNQEADWMTNEQGHGGGWYAYWCGVDHDDCYFFAGMAQLLQQVASNNSGAAIVSVLGDLEAQGVTSTITPIGIRLASQCGRKLVSVVVPLNTQVLSSILLRASLGYALAVVEPES